MADNETDEKILAITSRVLFKGQDAGIDHITTTLYWTMMNGLK